MSKKQTKLKLFCFFQHFRFGFCIEKSQKPKINLEFLLLSWLIISIQQKHVFSFFHFKTKTKQKKPREHKKMSQNQTLSHMFCFFGFMVLLVFVFVCSLIHMIAICVLMLSYNYSPNILKHRSAEMPPMSAPSVRYCFSGCALYAIICPPPKQKTQLVISIKKASR